MDSFMELSPELVPLTQQLAHSRHQEARSQVWKPYIPMDQLQYWGNPVDPQFCPSTLAFIQCVSHSPIVLIWHR